MERITNRQIMFFGVAYTLDSTLISVPAQIIGSSRALYWASFLLAMSLFLLILWIMGRVMARFPEQDLFTAAVSRHAVLGRLLILAYLLSFTYILCRDLRMLADFFNLSLLPNTPVPVISAMIILVAVLGARGGVEIVARMNAPTLALLLIVVLSIPILTLRELDWRYLRPMFEQGIGGMLEGAWFAMGYLGEVIALPILVAGRTFDSRAASMGLIVGTAMMLILSTANLLVLGPELTTRFHYPNYEVIRQIRVTDFLDRFDLPMLVVWGGAMIVKISISLYLLIHGLGRIFPRAETKLLATPVGAFCFANAHWLFPNALQPFKMNRTWPVVMFLVGVILPMLLFFFLRPRRPLPVDATADTPAVDRTE